MHPTRRNLVVVVLLAALAAITVWGPTVAIMIAWMIAALALAGAGMSLSPSIRLRGRVNGMDSGSGAPVDERDSARPYT
jgi:hypothetical protein